MVIAPVIALLAMVLVLVAEALHARRCRVVAALAFGPAEAPRPWVKHVPYLRALAVGVFVWGCTTLLLIKPIAGGERDFPEEKLRHVIFVLDVSPSMEGIADAGEDKGAGGGRISRASRAKAIAADLINRMAHDQLHFSLLAFYTEARPVVVDCPDPSLVLEMMDRPLSNAFEPGATDMIRGVALACDVARDWRTGSATMVLISDGDTVEETAIPVLPEAIGRVVVVGVGDPRQPTEIHEHLSRQDRGELTKLSRRLGGSYHDGNLTWVSDQLLGDLTKPQPLGRVLVWTRRELAILAVVIGAAVLAAIPLALEFFGESANYIKGREKIA
ncbi:VWA domain-containing protein [Haloferula sp. A504]|uniref:VWA domain-containing protein n=1 Tax=Haloferula sp. A504 TaxID=3373601 RepID=UPI0031BF176B|nr:VWA domain-containing protein [Verrucomicrobiaceae bacterium E54]